jgi:predicted MFS family arabinose efflux permease
MRTPPRVAVRRLAIARFISTFGSMAAYTALIDLIWRKTDGSTVLLSVTILLTMGAQGLFGPIGGGIADRWDRKRVLIASDVAGAALFVALAFVHVPWAIMLVALLTSIARTPFRAGSVAAIPNLVEDETLIAKANGWMSIGANLGITVGPAVGGILVGSIGAGSVFVLNAASFIASAALVASIHAPFSGVRDEDHEREHRGMLAGFRFLRRDHVLVVITFAWATLVLGMALGIVADRPIAAAFDVGSVGFGVMIGLYGLGSVLGAIGASRLSAAAEPRALVGGLLAAGIGGVVIGTAPAFGVVISGNFVWGIGDGVTGVSTNGIVQRRTVDAVRARVFAANDALIQFALVIGFLVAGPVIARTGPKAAYVISGIAAFAAAVLAWSVATRARPRTTSPTEVSTEPIVPSV